MVKSSKKKGSKLEKVVHVEWADAAGATRAWQEDVHTVEVSSVGFLVEKNKREVVIALSRAGDGDAGGRLVIPRGCIKKINELAKWEK